MQKLLDKGCHYREGREIIFVVKYDIMRLNNSLKPSH